MKCPHCNGTGEITSAHFGDLIHAVRRNRGMSQEDLAEKLGETKAFVMRLEQGNPNIPVGMLSDVAEALGCQAKDLVP